MTQFAEVRSWLSDAIERVHEVQPELWTLRVGERARVAQVFLELRALVPRTWDVDCEYNREGIEGDSKRWDRGVLGTPDIVIHHRGLTGPDHNLLVAEFKSDSANLNRSSKDYEKVSAWVRKFKYQVAAVVSLGPSDTVFRPRALWISEEHSSPSPEDLASRN